MFIKKEIKDNLCILTVNREEALNAMNPNVLHELYDTMVSSINDKDIINFAIKKNISLYFIKNRLFKH